tara:strand:+ start:160 stop:429 length:270 start_codon:yes stop_codon:yes gene_type:complete
MTDKIKRNRLSVNSPVEQQFYRANDICKVLSIGQSTFYKWVKGKKLPQAHAKLSKKCTVWLKEDIDNFIKNENENPNPEYDSVNFREVS